jgi:hypothetical protein
LSPFESASAKRSAVFTAGESWRGEACADFLAAWARSRLPAENTIAVESEKAVKRTLLKSAFPRFMAYQPPVSR